MDNLLKEALTKIPQIDKKTKHKIITDFTSLQDIIRRQDYLNQIIKKRNTIRKIVSRMIGNNIISSDEVLYQSALDYILKMRFENLYADEPPIFLGTSNIAQQFWCHKTAIYRSIKDEFLFRSTYKEIIEEGASLSIEEINKLLKKQQQKEINNKNNNIKPIAIDNLPQEKIANIKNEAFVFKEEIYDIDDKNSWKKVGKTEYDVKNQEYKVLDLNIGKWKRVKIINNEIFEKIVDTDTIFIYNPFNKFERGVADEISYAEKYPSIRYYFKYRNKIIIAAPDGITDDFCYEFKSTGSEYLLRYIQPVALAQASLYSYFFKRPKIRVQIYIRNTKKIKTIEKNLSTEEAEKYLDDMIDLLEGKKEIILPKQWKCKNCEYKKYCFQEN